MRMENPTIIEDIFFLGSGCFQPANVAVYWSVTGFSPTFEKVSFLGLVFFVTSSSQLKISEKTMTINDAPSVGPPPGESHTVTPGEKPTLFWGKKNPKSASSSNLKGYRPWGGGSIAGTYGSNVFFFCIDMLIILVGG